LITDDNNFSLSFTLNIFSLRLGSCHTKQALTWEWYNQQIYRCFIATGRRHRRRHSVF